MILKYVLAGTAHCDTKLHEGGKVTTDVPTACSIRVALIVTTELGGVGTQTQIRTPHGFKLKL